MSGYQEVLTDPSYAGQIVCMTYPLIGNYGVNAADAESARPWVEGFVVREASRTAVELARGRNARRLPEALEHRRPSTTSTRAPSSATSATAERCAPVCQPLDLDEQSLLEKALRLARRWRTGNWRASSPRAEPYEVAAEGAGAFPRRLLRLRREAELFARVRASGLPCDGRARCDARGGSFGDEARRHLPLERAGRPGVDDGGGRGDPARRRSRACRPSASASAISCWGAPSAGRPTSCASATAAATSPSRI